MVPRVRLASSASEVRAFAERPLERIELGLADSALRPCSASRHAARAPTG